VPGCRRTRGRGSLPLESLNARRYAAAQMPPRCSVATALVLAELRETKTCSTADLALLAAEELKALGGRRRAD
jgi:hypothetical protein